MSRTAIRAWYCATGVNCATALTSPAAQIPAADVRMCSSTTIPALVVSTPTSSRFRPSTLGTRPDARRICSTRSSRSDEPSRGASVATIAPPSRRALLTNAEGTTSIPSSSSAAARVADASASASGAMRSSASTIVTVDPKRANIWPNSSPTAPAPTTRRDFGSSVSSSAPTWSIQPTSSRPSIGGTAVREPVAIRIRSVSSTWPPARTVRPSTSAASFVNVAKPWSSRSETHLSCGFLSVSFRAFTRARSIFAGPASTPSRATSSLMSCASSAATRYAFVGVHATFGQLPPQRSFSTRATRAP